MQICRVALLLLSLGAVVGRRINKQNDHVSAAGGHACHVTENANSLKFGIGGSFQVKSCMFCKFHHFLTVTMSKDAVSEPELSEDGKHCKCFTSPMFWEAHGQEKKFWFEHQHTNSKQPCTKSDCVHVFKTWANMFNKKSKYPGYSERMPVDKMIDSQEGYDFRCDESTPEGLTLPSPADKMLQLRLQIERCTDPEEKLRLQSLLGDLLKDKAVEVFAYALNEEWGPTEHDIDAGGNTGTEEHDDLHTFFLKPCMSSTDREVTDLHEIFQLCGMPEVGVSMKPGRWKAAYDLQADWGPERECVPSEYECQLVQSIAEEEKQLKSQILSFRVKPCMSANGEEIEKLDEIIKVCGRPSMISDSDGSFGLLPVKMDVSRQYDQAAELSDGLNFPCKQ